YEWHEAARSCGQNFRGPSPACGLGCREAAGEGLLPMRARISCISTSALTGPSPGPSLRSGPPSPRSRGARGVETQVPLPLASRTLEVPFALAKTLEVPLPLAGEGAAKRRVRAYCPYTSACVW